MTSSLKNDLLLRALLREPTPRRPIWLMRQAGRYLPEYRATRARAGSFMAMCTNPELACEVTLQPIDRFPLDAAILFSDILTIPHAMNVGLEFEAGEGPKIERPIRSAADVDGLIIPDPARELRYVIDAVALIRRELHGRVPLIGFAGSPWTVGTYMVEGGGSKTFGRIKRMMYEAPQLLHRLLDVLARSTILYLNAQIAAGAQTVMLFDTWGGVLTPAQYQEFSLRYLAQVVDALTRESDGRRVPNIVFTKGGGAWLGKIAAIGCDAVGVDWTTDLRNARAAVGGRFEPTRDASGRVEQVRRERHFARGTDRPDHVPRRRERDARTHSKGSGNCAGPVAKRPRNRPPAAETAFSIAARPASLPTKDATAAPSMVPAAAGDAYDGCGYAPSAGCRPRTTASRRSASVRERSSNARKPSTARAYPGEMARGATSPRGPSAFRLMVTLRLSSPRIIATASRRN